VALVGDGDSGPRVLAALIGGQLHPSTGTLTFGGVDLTTADPVERAHRIAYAGGHTVLMRGTLRENFLYGCPKEESDLENRLSEATAIAGLDRLIHARGLAGTLNPRTEPKLASAIVDSRRVVQAALQTDGLARFVDPFDVERYNNHATIGENILFGRPIGDTFQEDNLASHPFMRAILEAEDLTKPMTAMGVSIATSMIEIFSEIPDGHPLFERFSFFSAADRAYFEDLVERRNERRRRGAESARDRERLIGLALRYSESRHRLGLLDEVMRARLLAARADFAKMLPTSLQPAIEFYDPARICTSASLLDNLLFGRIAADQAGAEASVHAVISRVLTERGLDRDVSRIGLESPVDTRGDDLTSSEIAAIDLVRCLVRRPDVLIVERALEGLTGQAADGLVSRLRRSLVGRGLLLVTPEVTPAMASTPFDAVIRFERGTPVVQEGPTRQAERMSA
jgi:ABC-type thiamine transport system ATPase subunit